MGETGLRVTAARMSPLVSVLIPCFNSKQTLRETVESVLGQIYRNIECIVIDDGSTDGSHELALAIAETDCRVKVLSHPNRVNLGVSATRNLGLDLAAGELIAFLDADDVWLPNKLERQVPLFTDRPEIGFVFSDTYICVNPDPLLPMLEQTLLRDDFRSRNQLIFNGESRQAINVLLFHESPFRLIPSPTPIVRAKLFQDGLRFVGPPHLSLQYEDFLMWKCVAAKTSMLAIGDPLAIYRSHTKSFTGSFHSTGRMLDHLRCLEEVDENFLFCLPKSFPAEEIVGRMKQRLNEHFIRAAWKLPISDWFSLLAMGTRRSIGRRIAFTFALRTIHAISHYISRLRVRTQKAVRFFGIKQT